MAIADRFDVVLVEPGNSANVGAVARAMANLGFSRLHLVAPRRYDRALAAVSACWAEPVLDNAEVHDDLAAALLPMQDVVGFSMRGGLNPPHWMALPRWVGELTAESAVAARTALVFGPEENGLTTAHLEHCRRVLRIPSAAECPSFNLSQAVLVVLYELTRSLGEEGRGGRGVRSPDLPTRADLAPLERLLDNLMHESGFIRPGSSEPAPGVVRNLFRRLPMDRRELGVLMGLFGRVQTALRRSGGSAE